MTRIGIHPDDEGMALIRKISGLPGLQIEGIFTHFATADEADRTKTYHQMTLFKEYADRVDDELGIRIPMRHCSNSAGIAGIPEANMDAVRAGIILYGLWPSDEVKADGRIQLRPMLSLKSRVVYVKMVPRGQEISYGGTYTTTRDTRVVVYVTDIEQPVRVGEQVTLIGRDGGACITMEELGALSGRFNYELACDIGKRIPRIYRMDDTLIYEWG